MKEQRILILLTQKFPFESGEEFLATELKTLEKAFDQVILVPTAVRDYSNPRQTASNTQVRIFKNPQTTKEIALAFLNKFFKTISLLSSELKKSGWNWKLLKYYLYHIPYALQLKSKISNELEAKGEFVLYSYWMDTNAFAAALLKKEIPEVKLIVRSHGGDLYNERQESGAVAFRQTVYEEANSLIFISQHGRKYASTNYPEFSSKMKLFRLGVEDHGLAPRVNFPDSFQLISCSSLISLKRLVLIAEVLNHSRLPISWTHFGGENSEILALNNSLPNLRDGLTIHWMGKVTNEELHSYYASHLVDVFINLSSSEGIPVSIMEAISFGIPIFSNAVGGIPEIVLPETGTLISEGLSVTKIASRLDAFLRSGESRMEDFRKGVRSFWDANYSAVHNHNQVLIHLLSYGFKKTKRI